MIGRIKSWKSISDACGVIVSLSGKEIPVNQEPQIQNQWQTIASHASKLTEFFYIFG